MTRDSQSAESHSAFKKWTEKRFPRRYLVAVLAFFGFFNVYSLRVNLSMAIVAMTVNQSVEVNGTTVYVREFDWNSKEQGLLLGSFFYGYLVTQLPGGWLAPTIGAAKLYGLGILSTALLTLITPLIATWGLAPLVGVRILEGLFEGVTFPAMHELWSHWAPPLERSKLVTIAFSGSYAGTVVSMIVCGILAESWGWASIFYVSGIVALIWCTLWLIVVKEKPQHDQSISQKELDYIVSSLGQTSTYNKSVPWKSILTSLPVWAVVAAHFAENWGFYTLLTQLPTFLSDVSQLKLNKTGFLVAIPYLVMAIVLQIGGQCADVMRTKLSFSTTTVRKAFTCGAFAIQTIFMLATAYTDGLASAITFLTIAVGCGGLAWSGFSVNHLDIAPQYASLLMGLSNTFATLPGILSPSITGFLVQNKGGGQEAWRVVFLINGFVYLLGTLFYGLKASGERQKWAEMTDIDTIEETEALMDSDNL